VAFPADSLGEATLALDSLEQAVRENDYWILWLRFKTFDSIRRDARFQKLLQSDPQLKLVVDNVRPLPFPDILCCLSIVSVYPLGGPT